MRWLALIVLLAAGSTSAAPTPAAQKPQAAAKAKAKAKAKGKTKRKAKPHAGRVKAAQPSAGYRAHVRGWHENEPGASAPIDREGRPKLVLEAINLRERVELEVGKDGFSSSELARARRVLRDSRGNKEHHVDPGLLDLLYKLQIHFGAPCIRVISAYRSGRGSRHALGQAADIVVPGAEDRAVAAYARTLGTTGVGLYPTSGFVHIDVRESSHYWVDSSGPGAPSRRAKPARARGKHGARPKKTRVAAPKHDDHGG